MINDEFAFHTLSLFSFPTRSHGLGINYKALFSIDSFSQTFLKIFWEAKDSKRNIFPSMISGFKADGKQLDDPELCWGSVDGFRLMAIKRDWLCKGHQKYHEMGEGEWFVTICLCAGIALSDAVALRTAIIRHLGLAQISIEQVLIDKPFEKKLKQQFNWQNVVALANRIQQGSEPAAVIDRQVNKIVGIDRTLSALTLQGTLQERLDKGFELSRSDKRGAVEHFRFLRESYPKSVEVLYGHAYALTMLAKELPIPEQQRPFLQRAKEALEQVIALNPCHENTSPLLESIKQDIKALANEEIPIVPELQPAFPGGKASLMTIKTFSNNKLTFGGEIGKGSYGSVYLGYHDNDERTLQVAVKRFNVTRLEGKKAIEFLTDVAMLMRLDSPYLVKCIDLVALPNNYCLVMHYMPIGSLHRLICSNSTSLNALQIQWIAQDVAKGLSFLHDNSVVHRDLKSDNVLIDNDYRAKITDFGLIKVKTDASSSATAVKAVCALAWLAPEIIAGSSSIPGYEADIYSYGLLLWQLFAKKSPYAGSGLNEIVNYKISKKHEQITPNTPPKFSQLIRWCWNDTPAVRPTAQDVVKALDEDGLVKSVKPS